MPPATPSPNLPLSIVGLVLFCWIVAAQIRILGAALRRQPFWPEPAPPRVPWNERGVLSLLLAWIVLQIGVSSLFVDRGAGAPSPRDLMLVTGFVNILLLVGGPSLLAWVSRVRREDLHLLGPDPAAGFVRGIKSWPYLACWIYGAFFLALQYWGASKHPLEEWIRADRSPLTTLLASVTAVVLAPASEEFLFRGVLLGWLTRLALPRPQPELVMPSEFAEEPPIPAETTVTASRPPLFKFWLANITTSIIFAMMHWTVWPTPVPLFLLSLALGVLYQRTGGIAAPLGLHVTFNGISTLILNLSLLGGGEPPLVPVEVKAVVSGPSLLMQGCIP